MKIIRFPLVQTNENSLVSKLPNAGSPLFIQYRDRARDELLVWAICCRRCAQCELIRSRR
jgi:hypothetical protein